MVLRFFFCHTNGRKEKRFLDSESNISFCMFLHLLQVLNCIVDMVEKTRRSVSVLRRCQESDREELNYWRRRSSEQEDPRKGGSGSAPFSKMHSPHSAESGGFRCVFQSCWSAAGDMLSLFLRVAPIVFHERRFFFLPPSHVPWDEAKPTEICYYGFFQINPNL